LHARAIERRREIHLHFIALTFKREYQDQSSQTRRYQRRDYFVLREVNVDGSKKISEKKEEIPRSRSSSFNRALGKEVSLRRSIISYYRHHRRCLRTYRRKLHPRPQIHPMIHLRLSRRHFLHKSLNPPPHHYSYPTYQSYE